MIPNYGNLVTMPDSDDVFPDDVPVADAIEQQRSPVDSASDEEDATSLQPEGDVPLETSPADWQEQREEVLTDPGYDELGP